MSADTLFQRPAGSRLTAQTTAPGHSPINARWPILRRTLLLAVLAAPIASPSSAQAGTPAVGNGAYEQPWTDIGKAGSALKVDFVVERPRLFDIYMVFERTKRADGSPAADAQALRDFVGTGQMARYALDAQGKPTDREVPDETQEERDWRDKGGMVIVQGVDEGPGESVRHVKLVERGSGIAHERTYPRPPSQWDFTPAGAGVGIPVAVRLVQQSPAAMVIDRMVDARGTVDGGTRRLVVSVALRPGTYELTLVPQQASALPAGIRPGLLITYDPRVEPSFQARR
jgi:hypothetical protein